MARATKIELQYLATAYRGLPFARVEAKGVFSDGLQYVWRGLPFVATAPLSIAAAAAITLGGVGLVAQGYFVAQIDALVTLPLLLLDGQAQSTLPFQATLSATFAVRGVDAQLTVRGAVGALCESRAAVSGHLQVRAAP